MGELVATGGVFVGSDQVASLERSIAYICKAFGFPALEEFKWSPRQNSWMHHNLIEENRREFFLWVLRTCVDHHVKATVLVCDTQYRTNQTGDSHATFVVKLLIERVNWLAKSARSQALIIADRPGGGLGTERAFLQRCLETIQNGTEYVLPENIAVNAVSTDSHLIRILQAADLVVSCVTAFIGGETRYSPPVFAAVCPLLASDLGRVGGVGLKLHPDFRYANLYHWLLGDRDFVRNMGSWPLPFPHRPYAQNAAVP